MNATLFIAQNEHIGGSPMPINSEIRQCKIDMFTDIDLLNITTLGLISKENQFNDNRYFYHNTQYIDNILIPYSHQELIKEIKQLRQENAYLKSLNELL